MRRSTRCGACLLPLVAILAGCSQDREAALTGRWQVDSTYATMMAVKMKNDTPGMSTAEATDAARRMGATTLDINEDNTFAMEWGGMKMHGDWTFDKDSGEVVLKIKKTEAPEANPEMSQQGEVGTWAAYLESTNDSLRLFPAPPEAVEMVKKSGGPMSKGIPLTQNAD